MNKKVRAKEIERGQRGQRVAHVRENINIVPTSAEKKCPMREREKPFYSPTLNTGADNKALRLRFSPCPCTGRAKPEGAQVGVTVDIFFDSTALLSLLCL